MTNNYSQEIENLFAEWQARQQKEPYEEYLKYGAPEIAKDSFTYDGIIDPPVYAKQDTKYLFISKESNIENEKDQRPFRSDGDNFWLRDVCLQKEKPQIFSNRLAMFANAIYSLDFEHVNKCHDILNKVAFMNLNKRGGLSRSKPKTIPKDTQKYAGFSGRRMQNNMIRDEEYNERKDRLETIPGYTNKYAGFIKREIDMIKPDIIICCGSGLRHLLGEIGICSPRYTVIEVYHPSYRISDKRHLEKLKAAFDEISAE